MFTQLEDLKNLNITSIEDNSNKQSITFECLINDEEYAKGKFKFEMPKALLNAKLITKTEQGKNKLKLRLDFDAIEDHDGQFASVWKID